MDFPPELQKIVMPQKVLSPKAPSENMMCCKFACLLSPCDDLETELERETIGRPSMQAFFGHPREPLSGY